MKSLALLFPLSFTLLAEPLDDWVNRSNDARANDIAYANGVFVAVSISGTDISADGTEWSRVWNGSGRSVAVHNDRFVSWRLGSVATSTDGTNWIARAFTPTLAVNAMAVWKEKIVLVGEAGSFWTSSDAINFQRFTVPTNAVLHNVSAANGLCFVSGIGFSFVSSDLTTWTRLRPDLSIRSVTFGRGVYAGAADQSIYSSTDGIQWAKTEYGGGHIVFDITYAHGYFIAGAASAGLWTSYDATNWTGRPTPPGSVALATVAAGPTRVVAGSSDAGYMIQSGEIKNDASAPTLGVATYPGITIPGVVGRSYRIEGTFTPENASSWSPLKTVTISESPFTWFDTVIPSESKRFYRATLLP